MKASGVLKADTDGASAIFLSRFFPIIPIGVLMCFGGAYLLSQRYGCEGRVELDHLACTLVHALRIVVPFLCAALLMTTSGLWLIFRGMGNLGVYTGTAGFGLATVWGAPLLAGLPVAALQAILG